MIDLPFAQDQLRGIEMELRDCAFPLLAGVVCTDNQSVGFKDTDYALLVGAKPRGPGMERGDLLKDNGAIFVDTGKAINDNSSRNIKAIVVGNPANTNALILANHASDIPKENFTAMTRLDHNRGLSLLQDHLQNNVASLSKFAIWVNSNIFSRVTTLQLWFHISITLPPMVPLSTSNLPGSEIPSPQESNKEVLKSFLLLSSLLLPLPVLPLSTTSETGP